MVMDRMMEVSKGNCRIGSERIGLVKDIVKSLIENAEYVLHFISRTPKITHFKISFSYEINTENNGSILYDKTWEEGKK